MAPCITKVTAVMSRPESDVCRQNISAVVVISLRTKAEAAHVFPPRLPPHIGSTCHITQSRLPQELNLNVMLSQHGAKLLATFECCNWNGTGRNLGRSHVTKSKTHKD